MKWLAFILRLDRCREACQADAVVYNIEVIASLNSPEVVEFATSQNHVSPTYRPIKWRKAPLSIA